MQILTNSEKLLLSSVGLFAISLTAIVILCVVKKSCWLHKAIWNDEKQKKKRHKMDDIICIRYPPDIYPTSLGVYRENLFRSPEEELARLFHSPLKRDSTYSSMSEASSGYELTSGSNSTTISSPTTAPLASTPESPENSNSASNSNSPSNQKRNDKISGSGNLNSNSMPPTTIPLPLPIGQDRRVSLSHLATATRDHLSNRATVSALAQEAAIAANQRFSLQNVTANQPSFRQPFFTFILKYEEDNGLVHIDFIEARNIPPKEYINQPSDVFFTLEIQPKKPGDRKKEMMRYRFVTKTIKKAGEICDFSEKFLAQLSKTHLKDYMIRFIAFDQDRYGNPTEIGTTVLSFDDFRDFTTNKLVLSCSLKEPVMKRGLVLLGLCFLPTAERLSVTIVKVNNLNPYFNDGTITKQRICYVRLLLLRSDTGKLIRKKKTTFQKLSGSTANQPVFNETIVFDMPPTELLKTVLLVLVCLTDKPPLPKGQREHHDKNENPTHHPSHQHPHLANRVSDESLFHYSDNLNKAKRSDSHGSNSSVQSTRSSAASSSTADKPSTSRRSSEDNKTDCSTSPNTTSPQSNASTNSYDDTCGASSKSHRVKDSVVGKVALGYCRNPMGKFHWENMMRVPRNVVTEWHTLK